MSDRASRRRTSGRRGALVAALALLVLLLVADLARGEDSALRGWTASLRGPRATPGERIIDVIRP